MANLQPTILEHTTLHDLVQYVLAHHGGTSTLVVCGSKEGFIEQLTAETAPRPEPSNDPGLESADVERPPVTSTNPWAVFTLRLLSTSRTVKLAFCPDITHLRAYLSTYCQRVGEQQSMGGTALIGGTRILAIVSAVQLHRLTSAFSAQGLNRTFAGAVEAAHRSDSKLVMAECVNDIDPAGEASSSPATEQANGELLAACSPWDEDVSILNVTTKSFRAGERGWVGRTVKLRTIAGRWCTFETFAGV